jgi:CubicO group peptidase (beta-lactamase class C family)
VRIGTLMLNPGVLERRRLLPEARVAASLVPCGRNPNYGLPWWLNTGDRRYLSATESRAGGNITWINPVNDLVAVMLLMDPAAVDGIIWIVMAGVSTAH